jgi:hypothetical protein
MADKNFQFRVGDQFDREWKRFLGEIGQSQQEAGIAMAVWYMAEARATAAREGVPAKHAYVIASVKRMLAEDDDRKVKHLLSTLSLIDERFETEANGPGKSGRKVGA